MTDAPPNTQLRVQVIATASPREMLRPASAQRQEDGSWHLEIERGTHGIETGDVLVLSSDGDGGSKVVGTVTQVSEHHVSLSPKVTQGTDRRLFPRFHAGLNLRFQQATPQQTVDYLAGQDPPEADWVATDPYMNISVEGLNFESPQPASANSLMVLEMQIPGVPGTWRCSARTIRSRPGLDDPEYPYSIAVAFMSIPPQATEALAALTSRLQVALLSA